MVDTIFNAPDADYLASEAARLGFAHDDGTIITTGSFDSGGGWFLNIVGEVADHPGYWGRLRLNGAPEQLPAFSDQIVQYVYSETLGGWTSDGSTLAPEWVSSIGMIA